MAGYHSKKYIFLIIFQYLILAALALAFTYALLKIYPYNGSTLWYSALAGAIIIFVNSFYLVFYYTRIRYQGLHAGKELMEETLAMLRIQMIAIASGLATNQKVTKLIGGSSLKKESADVQDIQANLVMLDSWIQKEQMNIQQKEVLKKNFIHEISKEIKLIFEYIFSNSITLIGTFDSFSEALIQERKDKTILAHDMSALIYYMQKSVPMISDFANETNKISGNMLEEILVDFKRVAQYSQEIAEKVRFTMQDFMDRQNQDSLAFMIDRAKELTSHFNQFYGDMESLKNSSSTFIHETSAKLQEIGKIVASIEGIAKTIRMLSINVSIEASNSSDKNTSSGFQVLARDLRAFADKTMQFAQEVKKHIGNTLKNTKGLQESYSENVDNVFESVEKIKESVLHFDSTIENSFQRIKGIIELLNEFSGRIQTELKDVVGKLQYYDVTKQEVEHLSEFMQKLNTVFIEYQNKHHVSGDLSEDETEYIKTAILNFVNKMITTQGERNILENYEKKYGIKVSKEFEIENKAGKELQKEEEEEDSVILF